MGRSRKRVAREWIAPVLPKSALGYRRVIGEAYQLAGALLLDEGPSALTPGQRERVHVLLLDVLAEPERFRPKLIAELYRLAVMK